MGAAAPHRSVLGQQCCLEPCLQKKLFETCCPISPALSPFSPSWWDLGPPSWLTACGDVNGLRYLPLWDCTPLGEDHPSLLACPAALTVSCCALEGGECAYHVVTQGMNQGK